LGDDCEVWLEREDLESTGSDHIHESTACGADHFIMVTLNAESQMPVTAVRISQVSMEWAELVFLPHVDELGCMYTTVKSTDVEPKKLKKYTLSGDTNTEDRRTKE
jgi:hypothetical protein